MGGIARLAATGVVLGVTWLAASGGAAVIPDSLIIRIYDNAGILAADRATAILRAREILSRAGLDIEWRDCTTRGGQSPAPCVTPPANGDLLVRLARAAGHDTTPKQLDTRFAIRALGNSLIDASTGSGTLATVFVDRVESVAQQAKADRWTMMGRVMAHEIGHLLLGTSTHGDSGLMREVWTLAEMTRNRAQDWMFSRAQRDTLRDARLAGRRLTTAAAERAGGIATSGG
jgi:hypothetical protein